MRVAAKEPKSLSLQKSVTFFQNSSYPVLVSFIGIVVIHRAGPNISCCVTTSQPLIKVLKSISEKTQGKGGPWLPGGNLTLDSINSVGRPCLDNVSIYGQELYIENIKFCIGKCEKSLKNNLSSIGKVINSSSIVNLNSNNIGKTILLSTLK